MLERIYTVAGAAEVLSVSYNHVLNLLNCGKLKGKDIRTRGSKHSWRITESAIAELLHARIIDSPEVSTSSAAGTGALLSRVPVPGRRRKAALK